MGDRSYQYVAGVRVLAPAERERVRDRRAQGESVTAIAKDLRVSQGTISAICNADEQGLYTHRKHEEPSRPGHPGSQEPRDYPYPPSTREVQTDQVDHIAREPVPPPPKADLKALIAHHREVLSALELLDGLSEPAKTEILAALGVPR